MPQGNIEKLKTARKLVVDVYSSEADDDKPDNGNLSILNAVILGINQAIDGLM
jgi:hypothetical protein